MVMMKTVSVSELKAQLSRYPRMVRCGSEVQILDRGVPIARLVAISDPASADSERLERLAGRASHEVSDLAAVRVRAIALLARHSRRAADAMQLGAALLVAAPDPASLIMTVLDKRLAAAAEREGLRVLTWPE
jgi:antitoxin (DNA-binding transcriptional repressor) of toxin-antitoxin stability system